MLLLIGLAGYFLPAIVARIRDHHQMLAILMLNLLLGWTVLGWVVAIVWACTATPGRAAQSPAAPLAFQGHVGSSGMGGGFEPARGRKGPSAAAQRWSAVITGLLLIGGIILALVLR